VKWLAAFGRFWWDFVVGDDWRLAAGALVAMAAAALVARVNVGGWSVAPTIVVGVLVASVARATSQRPDQTATLITAAAPGVALLSAAKRRH